MVLRYNRVMKKIFLGLTCILLAGCMQNSQRDSSVALNETVHQLASTSEVRSLDTEWNEYINHSLGISIKFPKQVREDSSNNTDRNNPFVPIKVTANGKIITFSC